jgi:hypothetical protein
MSETPDTNELFERSLTLMDFLKVWPEGMAFIDGLVDEWEISTDDLMFFLTNDGKISVSVKNDSNTKKVPPHTFGVPYDRIISQDHIAIDPKAWHFVEEFCKNNGLEGIDEFSIPDGIEFYIETEPPKLFVQLIGGNNKTEIPVELWQKRDTSI